MTLQRQVEILSELASIVDDQTDGGYDEAHCTYRYSEGAINTEFWWLSNGKETSRAMSSEARYRNFELLSELHDLVRRHTGGSWHTLEIALDETGKATSKFAHDPTEKNG